ncbi:MAG: N-6 DNA methylase [Gammaproteobacteria bacterium]
MNITQYIRALNAQLAGGDATEHSHRPALQALLEEAAPGARVTNEPKQIECGAPDFVLTRGDIPLGYVETKDIGKNLDDKAHSAQFKRYIDALDNLIITDYLEFRFFRDGVHVETARIGEIRDGRIVPRRVGFAEFEDLLANFIRHDGIAIATADNLAEYMAAKARMLAAAVADSLAQDKRSGGGEFQDQFDAFDKHLITDIEPVEFADIYAQTIAYGMFAARLHDKPQGAFSRKKAADLIPPHNPFLRKFFQHIAAHDLDKRIRWIVDALADLLRVAAVEELMAEYGKPTRRTDPFLHFYETFLGAYDPKKRKSRGVYYTPGPVVDFIVRAVDEVLRTEFGLRNGIAATDKTTIEVEAPGEKAKVAQEMHKVQILDPAAGTGTFLAAIVRHIHENYFTRQRGLWTDYVHQDLLPRLNGFEFLMAPYVMAHIKLEMVLRETGCVLRKRAQIFLTNTLSEPKHDILTKFARWLSDEANEANRIKRDAPVMVVIGNPPYFSESKNKGEWILDLLKDYKKEPGGKEKLNEKNIKPINDDYVKFIRYGQHYVDENRTGVLAYISNHGFLENPTFRGMRWSLLNSFDTVYIVDLHGNAKKQRVAPDGSADENVFLIRQGVSINLFVKTGKKKAGAPARVFHFDLYGERENKFQFLSEHGLAQVKFAELTPSASPRFFFVPKNYALLAEYEKGFSVDDAFPIHSAGIATSRDAFVIYATKKELQSAIAEFRVLDDESARARFSLGADSRDWKISLARKDLESNVFGNGNDAPVPVCQRPFDIQYTYYTGNSKGFHSMPRGKVMRHFLAGENIGLIFIKRVRQVGAWSAVFVTDKISNGATSISALDKNFCFPLYLYPETAQQTMAGAPDRKPNLNATIVDAIANAIGLRFTPEKETGNKTFAPIDLLDYIYAMLHAPSYRQHYDEWLKDDFPRVPYPANAAQFWQLAKLGGKLRKLHLLENGAAAPSTSFDITGNNTITAKISRDDYKITDAKNRLGRVHINATQYFGDVPEVAWNFFIGGYQPAQKYLTDRHNRRLGADEITHYQKIITALVETARLMAEIDRVGGAG